VTMGKRKDAPRAGSASRPTNSRTKGLRDWRDEKLARIRTLIRQADPEVDEQAKWRKPSNPEGIPVWYREGIVCTGETYKDHLRLTFARGASLEDPSGLFNANLEGSTTRAIVIGEGDRIDDGAFKALIRAAVSLNMVRKKHPT